MSVHAQTVIQWFEQFAPKQLAMDGDPVGLQVGTLEKKVHKVMVALELTAPVLQEAIEQHVDMIIAHHPLLFRPLKQLCTDLPQGRIIEQLVKHEITLYAAHTNLDIAQGGMNDWMAEALELTDTQVLVPTGHDMLKKLVVFVPLQNESSLRQALGDAGAGHIGDYSHCTFRTEGVGSFLPGEGTTPHIGQQGRLEQVQEVKIETIISESIQAKVLRSMISAHPYEEPAYDIYPLDLKGKEFGLGKIGYLKEVISLQELAQHIKTCFAVEHVRYVGDAQQAIRKVAVMGGKGAKYTSSAMRHGADVYITGDIDYHTAQDALADGICLIDPGHHAEHIMVRKVKELLDQAAQKQRSSVEIVTSKSNMDPFRAV